MSRRLVIDGQIFQTLAWHRGMGKYSLELLAVLSSSPAAKDWSTIDIVLSNQLQIAPGLINELANKVPKANIVQIDLQANDFRNHKIVEHNRIVIDSYLSSLPQSPDELDYMITSLMQGEIFPAFPTDPTIRKFVLFYDLIPLTFHDVYLTSSVTKTQYLAKLAELLKADIYFTISKTVANDLALYLGIDRGRTINIDGGPIDHGQNYTPIDVPEPFILMPTGNDPRKNNRRGVQGFHEFNKLQHGKYTLVITSFFQDSEKKELNKLADKLYFTDHIDGTTLSYLYEKATAVLFPSEYEGLGLPILEAVEHGKPVACSNISVFREMSTKAFQYFEPRSTLEIERALTNTITSLKVDQQEYAEIIRKYQWPATVKKLTRAILDTPSTTPVRKPANLAVFSADPSNDSTFAALTQICHGELSRGSSLEYFLAPANSEHKKRLNYLPYIAKTQKIANGFSYEPQKYDATLYYLCNEPTCAEVLLAALAVPGTVILEDLKLDAVWSALEQQNLVSTDRYQLEKQLNTAYALPDTEWLVSLVNSQKNIAVFSQTAKAQLKKLANRLKSQAQIHYIAMPLEELPYPEALPRKTITIGELYQHELASNDRRILARTDLQYYGAMSKMKTLVCDETSSPLDVVLAARLKALPFIKQKLLLDDQLAKTVQPYTTTTSAKAAAQKLVANQPAFLANTKKLDSAIQAYSIKAFVKQLSEIVVST